MANFKTHLTGAFAVSGILGLVGYKAELIGGQEFLICVVLGTVGGLLPDLDSDHSTPIKLGFDFASLFVAFSLVMHWRSELSFVSLILLWLASYAFVRYVVLKMFTKMTVHRGIIHSVPYMAVLALALVSFTYYIMDVMPINSWFYGLFLFIGALLHLTLDEAYSVDLANTRIKRSAGTAMKFYQHSAKFYYLVLYLLIALLIFLAPPFEPVWHKLTDPISWQLLREDFFPKKPNEASVENTLQGLLNKVQP